MSDEAAARLDHPTSGDVGTRLLVLEMTIAAVAARLPPADFEEVVSMLVFVANSSDAAREMENLPGSGVPLAEAGRYATAMLDRIAASRRAERPPERS